MLKNIKLLNPHTVAPAFMVMVISLLSWGLINFMENEIWKPIVGYEGLYEVSNLGNVKSCAISIKTPTGQSGIRAERMISQSTSAKGYKGFVLQREGIKKPVKTHRIVLEAFTGVSSDLQVDHINGIKDDNRVENLRYCTNRENSHFYRSKQKVTSKYMGVSKHKDGKWQARIVIGKKSKHLGLYVNEIDAHNAYQSELKKVQA